MNQEAWTHDADLYRVNKPPLTLDLQSIFFLYFMIFYSEADIDLQFKFASYGQI